MHSLCATHTLAALGALKCKSCTEWMHSLCASHTLAPGGALSAQIPTACNVESRCSPVLPLIRHDCASRNSCSLQVPGPKHAHERTPPPTNSTACLWERPNGGGRFLKNVVLGVTQDLRLSLVHSAHCREMTKHADSRIRGTHVQA